MKLQELASYLDVLMQSCTEALRLDACGGCRSAGDAASERWIQRRTWSFGDTSRRTLPPNPAKQRKRVNWHSWLFYKPVGPEEKNPLEGDARITQEGSTGDLQRVWLGSQAGSRVIRS